MGAAEKNKCNRSVFSDRDGWWTGGSTTAATHCRNRITVANSTYDPDIQDPVK